MALLRKLFTKKFGIISVFVCLLLGAAGFYTAQVVIHTTSATEFCLSCHEMTIPYKEYQQSKHYKNQFGVRAECADCHVPHGGIALIQAKVLAFKDVIGHVRGTIDTPEKYEEKRLEMAQNVWATMEKSDSRECRSCHSFDAMDSASQKEEAKSQHAKAQTDKQTCIACHRGVVHHKPDMSSLSRNALKQMQDAMTDQWKAGDTYYPMTVTTAYASPADDAEEAGLILPASPIKVVKVQGDWAEIEVTGWRQEDVDGLITAAKGHRIFQATLKEAGQSMVKTGQSWTDPDTEYKWTETTLTTWVKRAKMTKDLQSLWTYASNTYTASCSSCHTAYGPEHFTANQWPSIIKSMERFAQMPRDENFLVVKYLQLGASDVTGKKH